MGEGIGAAIHSGLLAADAIIHNQPYEINTIPRYSLLRLRIDGLAFLRFPGFAAAGLSNIIPMRMRDHRKDHPLARNFPMAFLTNADKNLLDTSIKIIYYTLV
jgi:hypothetical protein